MSTDFVRGVIAMGFVVAAGFFFRFWRDTRERLFAFFGVAFLLLATNRWLLSIYHDERNFHPALYGVRLLAFLILLLAIVEKNIRRS